MTAYSLILLFWFWIDGPTAGSLEATLHSPLFFFRREACQALLPGGSEGIVLVFIKVLGFCM